MNWRYCTRDFTVPPKGFIGFTYLIEFEDGKRYIGKKNFFSKRKRNFGKKEIAALKDKRLKKYEYVIKESNWKEYVSSNKEVIDRIKNGDKYTKHIVDFGRTNKHLSYLETDALFRNHVLWDSSYYNDNIAGKFYTKDIEEWERVKK